jgi:hypothetical protein
VSVLHSCPHCGCVLTKGRSGADHRRLFAVISAAFDQWPETHEFRPSDPEHLRAYLLVSVGHTHVTSVPVQEIAGDPKLMALVRPAVEATVAAIAARGSYAFVRVYADGIEVLSPRSISWSSLDQKAFGPIRDAVESLIEASLGVTAEQLLREKAA